MRRITLPITVLVLATLLTASRAPAAAPSPAECAPGDAIVFVQAGHPQDIVALVTSDEMLTFLKTIPQGEDALDAKKLREIRGLVKILEFQLETDWRTGVDAIFGGGVTLAAGADGAVLLIVDAKDPAMLDKLHETILNFARNGENADKVKSADYRGVTGWSFGDNEYHAVLDGRFVLSNKSEALKRVVDLHEDGPKGKSFASTKAYKDAKAAIGDKNDAWAVVNMDVVRRNPGVANALKPNENPWATLLLGGLIEQLSTSSYLAVSLDIEGTDLKLTAASDGEIASGTPLADFTKPETAGQGAMPTLTVPGLVATATLYRDLHAFYGAKDDLFPERTSELIFFENMMGIFFTGRDLTDEVFAELHPDVRIVAASQNYEDAAVEPDVKLPAFALVFRMRDPEKFSRVAEEGWQKAIGLVNFTSGQQAQPGLIIDRPRHGDVAFTVANYSSPPAGESGGQIRYNFAPTIAMPGEYLIIGTSAGLTRDLIDAVKKEADGGKKPSKSVQSAVEVDASVVAETLAGNRESLVRQNMLEKAHDREAAEAEIGNLLKIVKALGQVQLIVGESADGAFLATLNARLNLE